MKKYFVDQKRLNFLLLILQGLAVLENKLKYFINIFFNVHFSFFQNTFHFNIYKVLVVQKASTMNKKSYFGWNQKRYFTLYIWMLRRKWHCYSNMVLVCEKFLYLEFFWSVFPRILTDTKRYSVSLRIQFEWGKIRTRKTPNTDNFHAVAFRTIFQQYVESNELLY